MGEGGGRRSFHRTALLARVSCSYARTSFGRGTGSPRLDPLGIWPVVAARGERSMRPGPGGLGHADSLPTRFCAVRLGSDGGMVAAARGSVH
jgi:hypothetical protein